MAFILAFGAAARAFKTAPERWGDGFLMTCTGVHLCAAPRISGGSFQIKLGEKPSCSVEFCSLRVVRRARAFSMPASGLAAPPALFAGLAAKHHVPYDEQGGGGQAVRVGIPTASAGCISCCVGHLTVQRMQYPQLDASSAE